KAAKNNNINAMMKLSYCYLNGIGIEKNTNEAYKWFLKSINYSEKNHQYIHYLIVILNNEYILFLKNTSYQWYLNISFIVIVAIAIAVGYFLDMIRKSNLIDNVSKNDNISKIISPFLSGISIIVPIITSYLNKFSKKEIEKNIQLL
ncbi:7899_t:CDS:1, partial [Cetraspora pellucida]